MLVAAALACAELRAQAPRVEFGFDPCVASVPGDPGTSFDAEVRATIRVLDPGAPGIGDPGVQAWTFSIAAEGVEVVAVSTEHTIAASVDANPPGLREFGFEKTEVARVGFDACEGRPGAISAVVLSLSSPLVLPLAGTHAVMRIMVRGEFPAEPGAALPAFLGFVDGCEGSG